jgi:hypothetical protein
MTGNPLKYSSRTYNSIIDDINSDAELINKPNWFKRIFAGVGDVISAIINAVVNDLLLSESYTEKSADDLTALIDYFRTPQSTGQGKVLFYVKSDSGTGIFPFTALKENLTCLSSGTNSTSSKKFEARSNASFTLVTDNFTVNTTTNELTVTVDFAYTGHKVKVVTTGTLPSPLTTSAEYYVIYISATKIKLAETLAGAYAGTAINFTTTGTGTHTLQLFSKAVDCYQQESKTNVFVGTSEAGVEWQEFILPDKNILRDTLVIRINSITWTRVDDLINSTSTSKHYKFVTLSEDKYAIRFGNGTYGEIPGDFDIVSDFAVGGGLNSNISTLNRVNTYTGNDTNLNGASNAEKMSGGANKQSIETSKTLAPLLLKSRYKFITQSDGEALALAFGGSSQIKVNKNTYGVLSCQVLGIASGGGSLSSTLKTNLDAHLTDRSVLESIDIRVDDTTLTATNVTSGIKVLPGYTYATDVEPYVELGYLLITSETGKEIQDTFNGDGIEDAVSLINSIFTKSFTSTDYSEITKMLQSLNPVTIGGTIQTSDVNSLIDGITGVDYVTITVFGTGLPLSFGSASISTIGTITLSQIV